MRSIFSIVPMAVAGALLAATPAFAHPKLVSSTPEADATVAPTSQVSLTFSENLLAPMSGVQIIMTGMPGMPNHHMPVNGVKTSVQGEGKTLVATFPRALMAGTYQVSWHAVSSDTHRLQGTYSFTVK
jgi:methionine-rich copper-binding protein CopC